MKPEVIVPGLPFHDMVAKAVEESEQARHYRTAKEKAGKYNKLAAAYNRAPVDSYIGVNGYSGTVGNLGRVLDNRGLERGVDYEITRIKTDPSGTTVPRNRRVATIHKMSSTEMRII